MDKYAVIRTDLMSGTQNNADLRSVRFYDSKDEVAAVENGVIVELKGYETGKREVMKAVAATDASDLSNCVLIAGVEIMYDERKKNLDEYINEAGKATRGYVLRTGNMFGLTKEGFAGNVPAVGGAVGIGANGKLDSAKTGFGKCVAVEAVGRYTYYVIEITKA